MTISFFEKLSKAENAEEIAWINIKSFLDTLHPELLVATKAATIPHWFDRFIVANIFPEISNEKEKIFDELKKLPFVENFPDRGHNIDDYTRKMLLRHLWKNEKL